jgi:glycolate oxidase FAD binding subunit
MTHQSCLIDGFGPIPVVRPDSIAGLKEVIHQAGSDTSALYPIGGKTMLALGMPPTTPGHAVDLRGLDRIIDFPARDMTITVEAGISVARLRDILAKETLRLPIDVPQPEKATLGGAVAANVSGSRRYGFGTVRDYVIGISAVNDMGNEFKAGGRVVKNVAGYDLCKLLVGSLGTLGIITQLTLKLRPRTEEQALVILGCDDRGLAAALDQIHNSRTRPVCFDLCNRSAAQAMLGQANVPVPDGDWIAIIGYEGNPDAVNWQVQQLIRESGPSGSLEVLIGFTADPLWHAMAEWALWAGSHLTFKAALLPSVLASFCQAVNSPNVWLCAHAGNGIVLGHLSEQTTKEVAAEALTAWRRAACAGKGSVVVTRCPAEWKPTLSVWGPPPGGVWLMREVKAQFDPRRLFNPGRFVDGI